MRPNALLYVCLFMAGVITFMVGHVTADSAICPSTIQTEAVPPEAYIASWSRYWYRSDDGELWASGWAWYADGWKVGWRKPDGSTLSVSGRRLDGDAPPLETHIPEGYHGAFQSSALYFPTAGCWEVVARAGESEMTMIVSVHPKAYRSDGVLVDHCQRLEEAARASTIVIVAQMHGEVDDLYPEYGWATVRVSQALKGPVRSGDRLEFLQDRRFDVPMRLGETHLLFLVSVPGYHLRALCPTVSQIIDNRVVIADTAFNVPDWSGLSVSDIQTRVGDVVADEG